MIRGSWWSLSSLGLLILLGLLHPASAATPSAGTISRAAETVNWEGQHYGLGANPPGCPSAAEDPDNRVCDHFTLTVDVAPSFWTNRTGGALVTLNWPSPEDDFDLFVYDSQGDLVATSTQSDTASEQALILSASGTYEIRVSPFLVADSGYAGAASVVMQNEAASCPAEPAAAYDSGGIPGVGFPDDPLYPRQWGLRQINAPGAWAQGALGRGATIAIIDTGVDLQHPDLKRKIVGGAELTEGFPPGQPDDCPAGPQDENGHGTFVAGIAAADTNNGIGVAGVAPRARLMPIRIVGDDGRFWNGPAAIRLAADAGADVINMSFRIFPVPLPDGLLGEDWAAAVDYAWSRGAVLVAAAGNNSLPFCAEPASFPHVVCVAATDSRGLPSWYSNFPNELQRTVALRAPGGGLVVRCEDDEDIWSTFLPNVGRDKPCSSIASDASPGDNIIGYETWAGTSAATPHVAGVAALLAGRGLSNQQIIDCLRTTSSNHGQFDPVMGYGIVNAAAAVRDCS